MARSKVVAVMNGKGGVGKSLVAQILGMFLAYMGYRVRIWDLDGQPTTSFAFCRFADKWDYRTTGRRSNRRLALRKSPEKTVARVLLKPEMGLNGVALSFPLADALQASPQLLRDSETQATILDSLNRMSQIYGIGKRTMGSLTIIPSGGSFNDLLAKLIDAYKKPDDRLRILDHAIEVLGTNSDPVDIDLLDVSGERGIVPDMAAYTMDLAMIPFLATDSSVYGVQETLEDIERVSTARPRSARPSKIFPLILNMVKPKFHQEILRWVQEEAFPEELAEFRVQLCTHVIPESVNIGERANRSGTPPLLYDPMDGVNQSLFQITQEVIKMMELPYVA